MIYETHNTSRPYWWDIPPVSSNDGNGNKSLERLIKAIAGAIITLLIGMMVCSILGSCKSVKTKEDTSYVSHTQTDNRETENDSLKAKKNTTTTSNTLDSAYIWNNAHIEIIIWSQPDSNGTQYPVKTATIDSNGGMRQTKQSNDASNTTSEIERGASRNTHDESETSISNKISNSTVSTGHTTSTYAIWITIILSVLVTAAGFMIWKYKTSIITFLLHKLIGK